MKKCESGERSAQNKHWLQTKTFLNKDVVGFWCETTAENFFFFTGGSVIMDYGLIFWPEAMVWGLNRLNDGFVSFVFSRCVDYLRIIVMYLSAVWTLILTAPIHCRGSIGEQVMQCYISPNMMKTQTHLDELPVSTFSAKFTEYTNKFPFRDQKAPIAYHQYQKQIMLFIWVFLHPEM